MPVIYISSIEDMKTLIENALNSANITYEEYFYNDEYYFFFSGFATTKQYMYIKLTQDEVYLYDCDNYTIETDEYGNITGITTTDERLIGYNDWSSGNAFYTDIGDMVFMAWSYSGYCYMIIYDVNCFDGITRTVVGVSEINIAIGEEIILCSLDYIYGKDVNDELRLTKAILDVRDVPFAILDNIAVYDLSFGDIVLVDGSDYYFSIDEDNLLIRTKSDTSNNYVGHYINIFSVDSELYQPSIYTDVDTITIYDVECEIYQPSIYTDVDLCSSLMGWVSKETAKIICSKLEISKG